MGFKKFFDSHMQKNIGKYRLIQWNSLTQTVKMNELFSSSAFASQVLYAVRSFRHQNSQDFIRMRLDSNKSRSFLPTVIMITDQTESNPNPDCFDC